LVSLASIHSQSTTCARHLAFEPFVVLGNNLTLTLTLILKTWLLRTITIVVLQSSHGSGIG